MENRRYFDTILFRIAAKPFDKLWALTIFFSPDILRYMDHTPVLEENV